MGTLAISSANLNTLENNMLILNDNIRSVTGDIVNINGQINNVTGEVSNIKESFSSLEEEIHSFMKEIRGTTVVANAQNDILIKQQEYNKKFANYESVRHNLSGILDSINLNALSKSTLKNESEKIIYNTPNYYLSYALLAIASWFNDDKVGATKALNNALKLNDKKTSLLMAFVHTKLGRIATSYKWVKRYLKSQDPRSLDYDFTIFLDAFSENVFDKTINDLIKEELGRLTNSLKGSLDEYEANVQRFSEFFKNNKKNKNYEFYYLKNYSNNAARLIENAANAEGYFDAYFSFNKLLESKYREPKTIDILIRNLVNSYDYEELKLKSDIARDELLIKYNGDPVKVEKGLVNSNLIYNTENNLYTLLANILLERKDVAVSTKEMAASYLKDVIKAGLDNALPSSDMGVTTISINEYSGTTVNGENEKELIEDMKKAIRLPYDNRIKSASYINMKTVGSIVIAILGAILAFSGFLIPGLLIAIVAIAALVIFTMQILNLKERILLEYQDAEKKYQNVLENTLAEVVDINFIVKRAQDNYDYIIDYLNKFDVR